tara:strand:+ start:375 stop:683 length:309 start_codon:yes stop_codon:yes gene_type:complete
MKIKFWTLVFLNILILPNPLKSIESREFIAINRLVISCYKNVKICDQVLSQVNNYQRKAVIKKNFPCQTRLLGLEANIIMAMNSNLKRKEANNIIKDVKKYC